jgi:hypothetical protein
VIAHAEADAGSVGALLIPVIEGSLLARAVLLLRLASRVAATSGPTGRAVDLTAMATLADHEEAETPSAAKLDADLVHAPKCAEILPPRARLRDGPPVHAPAGHEGRELSLLVLDLCGATPS